MHSKIYISTTALVAGLAMISCGNSGSDTKTSLAWGSEVTIDSITLLDKIKGGWAGQTIGCTYGGPTEFKYKGATIHDSIPMIWYDDYCKDIFAEDPGLYDDVYMDLTFMEVMLRDGISAPAQAYADAFANADYKLWHANQAARYNILHGVNPPQSGHWKNNPHADDIDFQIEADFIGMICPGMPNTAAVYADRIGHIMNYGDGFYGGLFVSGMYSLAYVCDDIETVITEAIKLVPEEALFNRCIKDCVELWHQYPNDWRLSWLEIEKRYGNEKGCPEGVYNCFNIDAVMNSAYCVIGLLYGNGDFGKTMDIATRCGQDSDCNPATAGGILGVMIGYDAIPDKWKPALERCENIDFPYTKISLSKVYGYNLQLLGDVVVDNGGKVANRMYTVTLQKPEPVALEKSFDGIAPSERKVVKCDVDNERSWDFDGCGIVLQGLVRKESKTAGDDYIARVEISIDGNVVETVEMPVDYIKRKYDIFHTYDLEQGKHTITAKWLNPNASYAIQCKDIDVYSKVK